MDDSLIMHRVSITQGDLKLHPLQSDHSARTESLMSYLEWINDNYEFEHIAFIFLNHGGKLDEIGLDEHPTQEWMRIDSLAMCLEQFIDINGIPVTDLFSYQVCSKGSIAPLYEIGDYAEYTLQSQFLLGVPNYYYQQVFEMLSDSLVEDGFKLAELNTKSDSPDMYYAYTCVNNYALIDFVVWLNDLSNELLKKGVKRFNGKVRNTKYKDELYWDMGSFLKQMRTKTDVAEEIRLELIRMLEEEVVVLNLVNTDEKLVHGFSGLSILAFTEDPTLKKYAHLMFYGDE